MSISQMKKTKALWSNLQIGDAMSPYRSYLADRQYEMGLGSMGVEVHGGAHSNPPTSVLRLLPQELAEQGEWRDTMG